MPQETLSLKRDTAPQDLHCKRRLCFSRFWVQLIAIACIATFTWEWLWKYITTKDNRKNTPLPRRGFHISHRGCSSEILRKPLERYQEKMRWENTSPCPMIIFFNLFLSSRHAVKNIFSFSGSSPCPRGLWSQDQWKAKKLWRFFSPSHNRVKS